MIRSVVKALNILEVIQRNGGELSATEIAKKLGFELSTTHNIIRTLARREYLIQPDNSKSYRLGPGLVRLLDGALLEDELNRRLTPFASELSHAINEQVTISCFHEDSWRRIVRIDAKHAVTVNSDMLIHPYYSYATGRLLLADMPDKELARIWETYGDPGEEWPEVQSFNDFRRELEKIKLDGFSVVHSPQGITAIAAMLNVPISNTPLAIAVFLPTMRCDKTRELKLVQQLMQYVKKINRGELVTSS